MKVVLADDHALFREGMRLILNEVVSSRDLKLIEVASHEEALSALSFHPDTTLMLLDLEMPGMNCANPIKEAKELTGGSVTILVVSACDNIGVMHEVIAQGAHGFLPKTADKLMMILAIETVLSNHIFMPTDALTSKQLRVEGNLMTVRQKEVLHLLIQGASNKGISTELNIAERTVKMHVSNLMHIFKANNRTQVVSVARKQLLSET
ncbi:MAG: response regulator transcription factor [Mariprofundaceae bacterium]